MSDHSAVDDKILTARDTISLTETLTLAEAPKAEKPSFPVERQDEMLHHIVVGASSGAVPLA